MKALFVPIMLLIVGTGAGVGAGLVTATPVPTVETDPARADDTDAAVTVPPAPIAVTEEREYARLNNQFIIPILEDGMVAALVVMSLNIEVTAGNQSIVFAAEPKLRDRFLQVMFDHANTGGFSGNFTTGRNMRILRDDLLRAAKDVSGDNVTDVLIIDLVRQDT